MIWNYAKCLSLSNQKCMTQPIHINLHSNEYSQKFHYYPFAAKLDRCVEIAILLMTCLIKYVFQICVPEDLNHMDVNVNLMVGSEI